MAYIYRRSKKKEAIWFCQYRNQSGVRVSRSTQQIKRAEAQKVADAWEEAAKAARRGELTQEASIKTVTRLMEATGSGKLENPSITEAFARWLTSREEKRSVATANRYKSVLKSLFAYLGEQRIQRPVSTLTTEELESWRDAEMKDGKSGTTADLGITVIRGAMNRMIHTYKFFTANPALGVERSDIGSETREVFTDDEVLKILSVCDLEWFGMVLFSAWHSIRLHDAASLTWGNVDMERGILSYIPSKTRRKNPDPLELILASDLRNHLDSIPRGIGKTPIFPKLHGRTSGSHAGLSNEFRRILEKVGVKVPLGARKEGKGRRFRKKGFHSFRYFSISRMAEKDIPEQTRRMMGGHSANSIAHLKYLHLREESQRKALAQMSSLTDTKIRGSDHTSTRSGSSKAKPIQEHQKAPHKNSRSGTEKRREPVKATKIRGGLKSKHPPTKKLASRPKTLPVSPVR